MQEKNANEIYNLGYIIRLYKNSVNLCAKNLKRFRVQGSGFKGSEVPKFRGSDKP